MPELFQLFPTPVIVDDVPGGAEFNDALIAAILARRSTRSGVKLSNRGGWQSARDFSSWAGGPGERLIEHALGLASGHTVSKAPEGPQWTVDVWANVNEPGDYNMPHTHGGTFWSCVYYVKIDGQAGGELVLHDPRMPALRMHAPHLRFKDCGAEIRTKLVPKAGRMVLFPGWLSHSVEPWEGAGERISVAMNIRGKMPAKD